MQPGFGHAPVAFDGRGGDSHHFRGFFNRQTTEETEFDHSTLLLVDLSESSQCFVQRDDVQILVPFTAIVASSSETLYIRAAALGALLRARVIDEYASHHLGSDAEEVCAILPLHVALIHQAHVSLMNQGGCLQCVSCLFAA